MPSLTGSSPWSRRPAARSGLLLLVLLFGGARGAAAMPDYVREALGKIKETIPT